MIDDRRGIAGARGKNRGELETLEAELLRRLRQSARLGSLGIRIEHRIDELRRKIEQKRATLRRLENAAAIMRPQHRR